MREAELRSRLDAHLGRAPALMWAETHVLGSLGHRTVDQALSSGVPCKEIWRAAWAELELSDLHR